HCRPECHADIHDARVKRRNQHATCRADGQGSRKPEPQHQSNGTHHYRHECSDDIHNARGNHQSNSDHHCRPECHADIHDARVKRRANRARHAWCSDGGHSECSNRPCHARRAAANCGAQRAIKSNSGSSSGSDHQSYSVHLACCSSGARACRSECSDGPCPHHASANRGAQRRTAKSISGSNPRAEHQPDRAHLTCRSECTDRPHTYTVYATPRVHRTTGQTARDRSHCKSRPARRSQCPSGTEQLGTKRRAPPTRAATEQASCEHFGSRAKALAR
ncbi:hypothetical protein IV102_35895, partial [bacterium]|nr:hypothetical protein [bacterium]